MTNEKICPTCGWKNNSSNTNCYWCGSKLEDDSIRRRERIKKIWGNKK